MKENDLKKLKNQIKTEIETTITSINLDEVFNKYFGKKGELTLVLRSLKEKSEKERKIIGKLVNEIKEEVSERVKEKKCQMEGREEEGWLDVTLPGDKIVLGHLHPLTQSRRRVEEIFKSMGFSIAEGPEMESPWYNFDALNIPPDHPARDLWDTFYLENGLLLRTHTSPVQVRYLEKNQPPLRIIVPGNVFRHEATDASHEFQLFQIEGLMVEKKVSVAEFKAVIVQFLSKFFEKDIKIRLRPDFFPFTEPSFEIAINCLVCGGKGCSTCKQTGWMEVAGAGIVHPSVFKNSKLNPQDWQGWAFGFGLDRLTMLKYKINDVRLFRSADLRFLNQF